MSRKHIPACNRQAQTHLLKAKTITHHSHHKLIFFLNHYSAASDFGSSDSEAVVAKPACSSAACCSERKVGSRENSSSPTRKTKYLNLPEESDVQNFNKLGSIEMRITHILSIYENSI